ALLHHPAATHGHIRIPRPRRSWLLIGVAKKVEPANLVGAVVRTEPRADAAVVDHQVQALGIMVCRHDGTDQLAGRLFAVHAKHRLEELVGIVDAAIVVEVYPEPRHLSFPGHLVLADGRYVVFRLTGDDTGIAADARVQIDAHRPRRRAGRNPAIQVRLLTLVVGKIRRPLEIGEGAVL